MLSIKRETISVLCSIFMFLLIGSTYALSETVEPISIKTPVYYNPEGGSFYHLNPKCDGIHPDYQKKLESIPYRDLFSTLGAYLPCEKCVSLDFQTLWVGEKELREAWPVLEAYTQASGAELALPYAWKITPDMNMITISVRDARDYTFEYTLERNNTQWTVDE